MLVCISAKSQNWQPGYYYDVKGNKLAGLIKLKTSGRPPVKDEAFIEFKADKKAPSSKISASELGSFIVGRDSFVVAAAPRQGAWSRNELDFVDVIVDGDLNLYMFRGGGSGSGIQPGFSLGLGGGFGGGGGGFGYGVGGGISIPIGGSGRRNMYSYYYGANTAEMKELTPDNFSDIMSQVMGDEPEVVDKIRENKYNLGNIDKLVDYFYKQQSLHTN